MKFVIKQKYTIENTFREYQIMDYKKDGYIGFNEFVSFQVRKW